MCINKCVSKISSLLHGFLGFPRKENLLLLFASLLACFSSFISADNFYAQEVIEFYTIV